MRKSLLFLGIIFWSLCSHAIDQTVRVLIDENLKKISLSSQYPVRIQAANDNVLDLNFGKSQLSIEFYNQTWHIVHSAQGKTTEHKIKSHFLKMSSTLLNWENKAIDFPILLLANKNSISLIGNMSMNRYLKGVLPHEMPASWPIEALKTQAVASRSYALWKMKNTSQKNYDLKSSVSDQVFRMELIERMSSTHPQVNQALLETEGMYLVGHKNRLVKTYFHSDCGGDTESADLVWGKSNDLTHAARDVACAQRKSSWRSEWSLKKLKEKMMTSYFLPSDIELIDVIVRTQTQSQRVEHVDLLFSKGIFKRVRGEDIRRILGYDKIKSTLFSVKKEGFEMVFTGRGNGHGVGMCQWGARAMASSGKSFLHILNHYYPGAIIKTPDSLKAFQDNGRSRTVSSI